jgi:hypothetical protein
MTTNKYININTINETDIMSELYFKSYLFEYKSINTLEYNNEDAIIYINNNYDLYNQDISNINSNIKYLLTDRSTLKKIWKILPSHINKIICGDIIINDFQNNKFKYYCWLSENDDEILNNLINNQHNINDIIKIKNSFNDNCIMELSLNKCNKTIKYIFEFLKLNNFNSFIELLNDHNNKYKTTFGKMIEYDIKNLDNYVNYISDNSLQFIEENSNSNITLELLFKNKYHLAIQFINRLKNINPLILTICDNYYDKSIQDFINELNL